ncbi:MAG: hypothetical protein J3K34DRAFT_423509 [Monoraphidium minutum]|nr:MAG: hypothetical protein J3K34DRAFT_423509 [Monoraphidium minutum]
MPRSLHAPITNYTKRYDAALGRKAVDKAAAPGFVAAVQRAARDPGQGLILVCSGVPERGALRAARAAELLQAAGYTRVAVLSSGFAEWTIKFTNKLERRVIGFSIASGGTSIEQKDGGSSKASGVSGKSVEELVRDQLSNYQPPAGMYADA